MDGSRCSLEDVDALDRRAPGLPALTLTLLTLLAGCLVVLGELDRLVGMALAQDGYSASVTAAEQPRLPLPFPVAESRPWLTLHQVGEAAHPYVITYLVVDTLMVLVYGTVLWRVTRRVRNSWRRDRQSAEAPAPETPMAVLSRPRVWPVWAVVVTDLLENILLWALVRGPASPAPHQDLVRACAIVTSAKWVLIALAVLPVVYALLSTRRGHLWLRSHWRAVVAQRYSLLAFAPIAAIALLPGDGVLDQLPDVQRAWLDGTTREGSLPGLVHLFWAVLVLSLIALGLFFLGRLVTDITARRRGVPDDPPVQRPHAALWQWAYGPVVLLGLALVLVARGHGDEVRWLQLGLLCSVPVAIIVASWWLRRRHAGGALVQPPARRYSAAAVDQVQRLGDLLALAGPVVASLALVRSHTVLLALGEGTSLQRVVPVLALVGAVATWWVGPVLLSWLQRMPWLHGLLTPGEGPGVLPGNDTSMTRAGVPLASEPRRVWLLAWSMILVSTVLAVALCTWPVFFAHRLGAIGALMLALGVVTLLVGSTVVLHASYAPPEIFWISWLRLREAPVATLLTVSVLAAILSGSNQQVHGVRGLAAGGGTPEAPPAPTVGGPEGRSLEEALSRWGERTAGCTVRVPDTRPGAARNGEVDAIPLVLVAAEGGGIRAAYWTAAALEVVGEELACGLAPVAVASGVSGGAVGLAVSRFTAGGQHEAVEGVWRMGGPDALAQASLGLVLRDPVYTVAGLPSSLGDAPGDRWLDRAGLMETTWEGQAAGLAADFLSAPDTGEGGLAADLVLNSTAVSSGCRVLVSAITGTSVVGQETRATTCADLEAPLPFSRDLVTDYLRRPGQGEHCLSNLPASTAAMLASRFPYVTPSGVLGPCGTAPEAQLIDGGYAEGSGLGTLSDLAPTVLRAAAGSGSRSRPVLPLVLYLDNGRGSDIVPPPPTAVSEVLVPPVGYLNAGSTQKSTAAFLQRLVAHGVDEERMLPAQVYVVSQRSEPAVEAPLGWVLSQASRDDMDRSLSAARARADRLCDSGVLPDDELWRAGGQDYPQLPELLALVRPGCGGGT